jgi:CheY-like chemotaxis protein
MESYPAPDEKARQNALFVLFLEDCSEDIELCLRTLRSSNFYVNWDAAVTPGELVERARTLRYDVILSDYRMPGLTAWMSLRRCDLKALGRHSYW